MNRPMKRGREDEKNGTGAFGGSKGGSKAEAGGITFRLPWATPCLLQAAATHAIASNARLRL